MRIHVIQFNDENGDLIAQQWFCSSNCMFDAISEFDPYDVASAEEKKDIEYGAWPGGAETDYDVFCASCGVFLWKGLESDEQ